MLPTPALRRKNNNNKNKQTKITSETKTSKQNNTTQFWLNVGPAGGLFLLHLLLCLGPRIKSAQNIISFIPFFSKQAYYIDLLILDKQANCQGMGVSFSYFLQSISSSILISTATGGRSSYQFCTGKKDTQDIQNTATLAMSALCFIREKKTRACVCKRRTLQFLQFAIF